MSKLATETRGSAAIQALEAAWSKLREPDPDLRKLDMVLAAERQGNLGHFARSRWRGPGRGRGHEVAVSPVLFGAPEEVLATLLHEAVHILLWPGEHAGVSDDGRYHRTSFRDQCLEFGLACDWWNSRHGWAKTYWPTNRAIPSEFREVLECLKRELPLGLKGPQRFIGHRSRRALPKSGHTRLQCSCPRPRSVYVAQSVVDAGGVVCVLCGSVFKKPSQ